MARTVFCWLGSVLVFGCSENDRSHVEPAGGQPVASDRFEGTSWWLDQLGALARRDVKVSVRQTKELYLLTSEALDSADLSLNGTILRDSDGVLPALAPAEIGSGVVDLPPHAMAFIVYPNAGAPACE